jgi:adenylate cyclase
MRRLSAIMFTDMVGYSSLTQRNEALALELLEEHRVILRPFFTKHDGREIETIGDAFFVEFNSAVEATNCAIEIQTILHERNKTEIPERFILLRIGLHIGDVVYSEQHVQGDGVNIAARLEPLAKPGGICISEDVARQIRNKIDYPIIKAGPEKLKNISMPMDVYYIQLPWITGIRKNKSGVNKKRVLTFGLSLLTIISITLFLIFFRNNKASASSFSKYRLAVLPLNNISNDPNDEYFADGMTEEIISSVARIGGLNVIARTSSMRYKKTSKDIKEIGRELMVSAVLEGSVRRLNNKARITVQLINVSNEESLWSKDYDRELSDIFSIQSEIAASVAEELKVRIVQSEMQRPDKTTTQNMMAFQEYLIGKHFLNQRTPESIQTAREHFEKSIVSDPQFALPYPILAYCYTLIGVAGYGNIDRNIAESNAKKAVMKALELDSTLAEAHAALGYIKFRFDWDWKGAEAEFKKAIELKPGYSTAHEWYALYLAVQVKLDEALKEMQLAYELDPLSPSVNTGIARIYHFRNEYGKSLEQIKKTIKLDPEYAEAHFTAGMTYSKMKDYPKAVAELTKAIELSGRRPVMLGMLGAVYALSGKMDEARKIQLELESPPVNNDKQFALTTVLSNMGKTDEAFKILNHLVDEKYGIMIYMKVEKKYLGVENDPRYFALLRRMGF